MRMFVMCVCCVCVVVCVVVCVHVRKIIFLYLQYYLNTKIACPPSGYTFYTDNSKLLCHLIIEHKQRMPTA